MSATSSPEFELNRWATDSLRPAHERTSSVGRLIQQFTTPPSDQLQEYLEELAKYDDNAAQLLKRYTRLAPRKGGAILSRIVWPARSLLTDPNARFCTCFDRFHEELSDDVTFPLTTCATVAHIPEPRGDFTFMQLAASMWYGKSPELDHTIQQAIVWSLCKAWKMGERDRDMMLSDLDKHEQELPGWTGSLPSNASCPPTINIRDRRGLSLTFRWPAQAPKYDSDLDTYVWQRFCRMPELDYLKLRLLPSTDPSKERSHRIFMVMQSEQMLAKFKKQYDELCVAAVAEDIPSNESLCDPVFLLVVICTLIRSELVSFLQQSIKQWHRMTYEGRRKPSAGKIQFLLHYADFHDTAAMACDDVVRHIQQIRQSMIHIKAGEAVPTRVDSQFAKLHQLEDDLIYLATEIRKARNKIPSLKKTIREQLDLSQVTRTTIVTILVALYVPISFVSSFLGMNINGPPSEQYFNFTTSDYNPSSGSTANATSKPLIWTGSTSVASNRNWELESFWVAAIPLAIGTIVLPLAADSTGFFRWSLQTASEYHRLGSWVRVLIICIVATYLYLAYSLIAIFLEIPTCVALTLITIGKISTTTKDWVSPDGEPAAAPQRRHAGTMVLLWVAFGLFQAACWTFVVLLKFWDRQTVVPDPVGLAPWALLLLAYIVSKLKAEFRAQPVGTNT